MNHRLQTSLDFSKTQNQFLSVVFGIGGTTGGNKSGSVGASKGSSDRQWVDNASSIIGTESVNVNVDGKLKMEGSLIANIDKDGIDKENLNVKAGSLEAKDIYNYEKHSQEQYSFSESGRTGNDKEDVAQNNKDINDGYVNGKTRIVLQDQASEKTGITHATIGQGDIEIADGSDVSGLNRDVNNMNEIVSDKVTGALDVDLTIDNREFTEEGRKQINKDLEQAGGLVTAAKKMLDNINQEIDELMKHKTNNEGRTGDEDYARMGQDRYENKLDEKDNLKLQYTENGKPKLSEGYMMHIAQYVDGLGEIINGELTAEQKDMIQKAHDSNNLNMNSFDKIKEMFFTKFDNNKIFETIYNSDLTTKVITDEHDKMVAKVEKEYNTKKNDTFKMGTIAPSFIMTEIFNAIGEAKKALNKN